jgi:cytochrome c553
MTRNAWRRSLVLAAALALVGCRNAPTAFPEFVGDPAHGEALARQVCAACHGLDGRAVNPDAPNLAGQYPEYLAKQLAAFQPHGADPPKRLSEVMEPIATRLSADDIAGAAAYYARQPAVAAEPRASATLAQGRKVFTEGDPAADLPACITCHRADGQGIRPDFPRIGGQNPQYVDVQLSGWMAHRGHPGKLMSLIVPHLSDADRTAVADYVATLRPPPAN